MLKVERDDAETMVLVSDDANAENAAIQEAVEEGAPHLLENFESCEVGDDGLLRWKLPAPEWSSLMEVLDLLSNSLTVNPEDANAAFDVVEAAHQERQE